MKMGMGIFDPGIVFALLLRPALANLLGKTGAAAEIHRCR
jgi:hypothetical protein